MQITRTARRPLRLFGAALALAAASVPISALAQMPVSAVPAGVKSTYVPLGMSVPGVLYEPVTPGPKAQIAFVVMHPGGDYLTFSACMELSKRGYRVLCANTTGSKTGQFDDAALDDYLMQAGRAVGYLRRLPSVSKVVLFGHSGGATIMTAYQAIAEQGVAFCQDAAKVYKCPDMLANLPKADGVVLADANYGQAAMLLLSVDPSVKDDSSGFDVDPALDMYNPANGYIAQGSNYSPEFVRRFQAAQGRRYTALIARAQARMDAVKAGKGVVDENELFFAPGAAGTANKLFPSDVRLLSHSIKARPLVHKDGSMTTEIVRSVRPAVPGMMGPMPANKYRAALKTTVRGFLNSGAMRITADYGYGEDSMLRGIDWRSTYSANPGNVEGITVPILALGMTGGWEGLAAETIYDHARSADKAVAFIEGATHIYMTCTRCEKTPGQYGDTLKTTYDFVDGWAGKAGRFLAN